MLTCTLVLFLARRIFTKELPPVVTAMVFCVHPMHTESVAALVGRADLLAGCLLVVALLAIVPSSSAYQAYTPGDGLDPTFMPFKRFAIAVLAGTGAAFSKETGVTTFGLLMVRECLIALTSQPQLARQNMFRALWAHLQPRYQSKAYGLSHLEYLWMKYGSSIRMSLCLMMPILIVFFHMKLHGKYAMYQWTILENDYHHLARFDQRAMSYGYTHFLYFYKLALPLHSCYDYGFPCIPPVTSVLDWRNLLTLGFYLSFVFACARALGVQSLKFDGLGIPDPHLVWGLGIMLLTFLPAAQVLFPVGVILGERLLYLPSVGFALLAGKIFQCLPGAKAMKHQKSLYVAILLFWLVLCGWKSVSRGFEWQDERSLFLSCLDVCPDGIKNLNNLGFQRLNYEEAEEAGRYLDRAIELHPTFPQALYNRGLAYHFQGMDAEAIEKFEAHLALEPHEFKSKVHLGQSYILLASRVQGEGNIERAESLRNQGKYWLDLALLQPDNLYPLAHHQRGYAAYEDEDYEAAVYHYQKAAEQNVEVLETKGPNASELVAFELIYNMLAISLQALNRIDEAEAVFHEALSYNPNSHECLANLASIQTSRGEYEIAQSNLMKAYSVQPNSAEIVNNLGWVSELSGDYETALASYTRALELMHPYRHPQIVTNLENLQKRMSMERN